MKNSPCCSDDGSGDSSFFCESPCTPVSKSTRRFNYRFGVTRLILAAEAAGLPWLSTVTAIRLYTALQLSSRTRFPSLAVAATARTPHKGITTK